jgi:hypothetical protein
MATMEDNITNRIKKAFFSDEKSAIYWLEKLNYRINGILTLILLSDCRELTGLSM